jgi:GNAT superfamily N-acetyltransferase
MTLDRVALLTAYDSRLRAYVPATQPDGMRLDHNGPLVRWLGPGRRGYVLYRDLDGLQGPGLDELIVRQCEHFGRHGLAFEWKYHGHDQPADLPDRLVAAGFVPEERETVVIGRAVEVAAMPVLPEGVSLRHVTAATDLRRVAAVQSLVWGGDFDWLARELAIELATGPDTLTVVTVEAGAEVVCAGWIRFVPDTGFATLWGGSTLSRWRHRGLYRALVAHRARLAADRGIAYLEVDASDDSRPILERLGFVAVTTTTPYVWTPPEPFPAKGEGPDFGV